MARNVQYNTVLYFFLVVAMLHCPVISSTDIIPNVKKNSAIKDIKHIAILDSNNNTSVEDNITMSPKKLVPIEVHGNEVTAFTVDLYIISVGSILSASVFLIIVSTYMAFVHWKIYKKQNKIMTHCCKNDCHQGTSVAPIPLLESQNGYDDAVPLFGSSTDQLPPVPPVFPDELREVHTYLTVLSDAIPLPPLEVQQRPPEVKDLEENDGYIYPITKGTSCIDNLSILSEVAAKNQNKIFNHNCHDH